MDAAKSPPVWRQIQKTNFVQWDKLADFLQLTEEQRRQIDPKPQFPLNLPCRLVSKIEKGNLNDPLLRQFLPLKQERQHALAFVDDPVGDLACRRTSKLLHKYSSRVLLVSTSACAMHCRYCFRQNYPYESSGHDFENEIRLIAADESIREVILSGGDPLSLSNHNLCKLFSSLSLIKHIKRVRLHTRFPIGIPERIDAELLQMFQEFPKQIWVVIHSNHPNELDEDVLASLKAIQKLGIPVLNQSVLLRGVNDDAATLKTLCEKLVDQGITPYYLHQLDRVQGAAHFEVAEEKGLKLIEELRAQLSGYAVPSYVREISGEASKTPITW